MKAVGRSNWHPRLRSSVCSAHFTEECFDRSGEKVTLQPGAVPTLLVHGDSAVSTPTSCISDSWMMIMFCKQTAGCLFLHRRAVKIWTSLLQGRRYVDFGMIIRVYWPKFWLIYELCVSVWAGLFCKIWCCGSLPEQTQVSSRTDLCREKHIQEVLQEVCHQRFVQKSI